MAKNKKTKWHCADCGHTEINNKHMDGMLCPKCKGHLWISKAVQS